MTVKETYEKWKHLDDQLSDAQYMAGPTASFQKLLLFDLWQAVTAHQAAAPGYTDGQIDERERILALLYDPEGAYFICDNVGHIYNEAEVRQIFSPTEEAPCPSSTYMRSGSIWTTYYL